MTEIRRLVIDGRRLTATRTGVGRYLETLLQAWAETGWPHDKTVLVVQDRAGLERVPASKGLCVEVVGEGWPGLVWERFGLGRVLRRGDLLFAPTNLILRSWRGPTVLVVFDTLLEAMPEGFSRLTRWRFRARYRSSARRASRVIAPSEATGRDVIRYYRVDPDRVRTIYPAIGPEFRPRRADDPIVVEARRSVGVGDHPFFLFVGKRSARRNVPAILDAFSRHHDRSPSDRLVFVGPGADPIPGDMPGVIHAGHVPDDILLGLFSSATACLYPSDYEGFGLPVVEAMASGCPVVTVKSPALIESGGEAAWSLDRASPEGLADAMARLSESGHERAAWVALGLAHVERFRGHGFAEAVRDEIQAEAGLAVELTRR